MAFTPVLECHEGQRGVLSLAGEAEAQNAHHALHFGLLQDELLHLFHHSQRSLLRGAGRELHVHDDVALVFAGQERRGQAHVDHGHSSHDGCVDHKVANRTLEHAGHPAFIALGARGEAAIEPAKKAALFVVMACFDRFEQRGTKGRRERQRHECREPDGGHHHGRELPIDVACGARKEGQWDEHRDQHHGHADDGA